MQHKVALKLYECVSDNESREKKKLLLNHLSIVPSPLILAATIYHFYIQSQILVTVVDFQS